MCARASGCVHAGIPGLVHAFMRGCVHARTCACVRMCAYVCMCACRLRCARAFQSEVASTGRGSSTSGCNIRARSGRSIFQPGIWTDSEGYRSGRCHLGPSVPGVRGESSTRSRVASGGLLVARGTIVGRVLVSMRARAVLGAAPARAQMMWRLRPGCLCMVAFVWMCAPTFVRNALAIPRASAASCRHVCMCACALLFARLCAHVRANVCAIINASGVMLCVCAEGLSRNLVMHGTLVASMRMRPSMTQRADARTTHFSPLPHQRCSIRPNMMLSWPMARLRWPSLAPSHLQFCGGRGRGGAGGRAGGRALGQAGLGAGGLGAGRVQAQMSAGQMFGQQAGRQAGE